MHWSFVARSPLPALRSSPDPSSDRLTVFLHGAGERGDDGFGALRYGLPEAVSRLGVPFTDLLVPQCPPGRRWTDCVEELEAVVRAAAVRRSGGQLAVSLTGFSMGGEGVWALAARCPDLFDRLGPIAARLPPDTTAQLIADRIRDLPVWVIHGADDERVPVASSDAIAAALGRRSARCRYDRLAGTDHLQTCAAAYERSDFLAWLAGW